MITKYWLPQALSIGIDYTLFWTLNPKKLEPFIEAHNKKTEAELERINYMCWLQGIYNSYAISARLSEKSEYPTKPIDFNAPRATELELAAAKFGAFAAQFNKDRKEAKDGS